MSAVFLGLSHPDSAAPVIRRKVFFVEEDFVLERVLTATSSLLLKVKSGNFILSVAGT